MAALALIGATLEAGHVPRVPWPAAVLAGFGAFSAFQAVPLPAAWVARLSPASADVWLRCLGPFGGRALSSFPLSLDAGESIAAALKWLIYACTYVMATRTRARRGSASLAVLLYGSVVLVTLITLLHGVAKISALYGVYPPRFTVGRWSVGPLLNSNNLGGYAILGLFSGAGLLLSGRSPVPRWLLIVGLIDISTALFLSGSRGAVLSVLGAGAVIFIWLVRGKRARLSVPGLAWGIGPVLIGIAVAMSLGTAKEAGNLTTLDVQRKVSVWLWTIPMIREHFMFGVGRGAFETGFSQYREGLDYDWSIVIAHAENFVIQWIAEWGVPIGLCAVVVIVGYVLREWYGNRRDGLRFMVMTGLVALFVQNLADLGFETPAVAIGAVLALAAGERPGPAEIEVRKGRGVLVGAAAVPMALLWVATLIWSRFPVAAERRDLSIEYRALSLRSASDVARFRNRLQMSVLRHPAEPFFPLLGSLVAMRTGSANALAWIARSLELAPTNGRVHLVLADLLHEHGATAQAMLHLRLAATYDRTVAGAVSTRARAWAPSIDVLLQAMPEGAYGESLLLDACGKQQHQKSKIDCFRRAVLRDAGSSQAQRQLADVLLAALQSGQPPCAEASMTACVSEADAAIKSAEKLEPKSWRLEYLLARLQLARGDALGASQRLTRVCPKNIEGDDCWRDALVAAIKSASDDAIATAANGAAARPCDSAEVCADKFTLIARSLRAGSQYALANTFFTKAAEADPSATRWLAVGEHAADTQLYGVARAASERADRSPDASVSTRARAELLRQRLERATESFR